MSAVADAESALIGPNAIIRTVEALREIAGVAATDDLLKAARLERYREEFPATMVAQDDVTALYRAVRERLDEPAASAVARLAGVKTAEYILANRIPKPAQTVLRLLPARFASPALLSSINHHTWTFAGSGTVSIVSGAKPRIAIEGCPICRGAVSDAPACSYYAASFEGLFRALVTRRARVTEVECEASGAPQCTFEIAF